MRIFWLNGGICIRHENKEEHQALATLLDGINNHKKVPACYDDEPTPTLMCRPVEAKATAFAAELTDQERSQPLLPDSWENKD